MDNTQYQAMNNKYSCRVCQSSDVRLVKKTNITKSLKSDDFKITDARYGMTFSVYECLRCGFLQCLDAPDTTVYYEALEDPEYELSRNERMHQAKKILAKILKEVGGSAKGVRLLDVGAGSGILLEMAKQMGFDAEGVEPSCWLRKAANAHGCKVCADVLPHSEIVGPYGIVTLIDVLEHVKDPLSTLQHSANVLGSGGVAVVITPDVKSVASRLMGWKWWHYRIAHVGYFSRRNLEDMFARVGLKIISVSRPSWSFSFAYLRERLLQYLPGFIVPRERPWMRKVSINLNLQDSLMIIAQRP
jgi:hypothetical protein